MMGRHSLKSADSLEYNSNGYLIPPQSGKPWDALTLLLAMAVPLIPTLTTTHLPFPPFLLHKLAVFQIQLSRGLLSNDHVALIELLFSLLLFARIVGFVIFFRKFTGKYSKQNPPPDALRMSWPPLIRKLLYAAAILVSIPLIFWTTVQYGVFPDKLVVQSVFLPIFVLSVGIWLLTEVAYGAVLYAYFYQRYWRFSV